MFKIPTLLSISLEREPGSCPKAVLLLLDYSSLVFSSPTVPDQQLSELASWNSGKAMEDEWGPFPKIKQSGTQKGFHAQQPNRALVGYTPSSSFCIAFSVNRSVSVFHHLGWFYYLMFYIYICYFLEPYLQHMEVPRPGVKLQLSVYTTPMATQDLDLICDLHYSSQQHWILNPLSKARDWTCLLMDTSQVRYCWATMGTPDYTFSFYFLFMYFLFLFLSFCLF